MQLIDKLIELIPLTIVSGIITIALRLMYNLILSHIKKRDEEMKTYMSETLENMKETLGKDIGEFGKKIEAMQTSVNNFIREFFEKHIRELEGKIADNKNKIEKQNQKIEDLDKNYVALKEDLLKNHDGLKKDFDSLRELYDRRKNENRG